MLVIEKTNVKFNSKRDDVNLLNLAINRNHCYDVIKGLVEKGAELNKLDEATCTELFKHENIDKLLELFLNHDSMLINVEIADILN